MTRSEIPPDSQSDAWLAFVEANDLQALCASWLPIQVEMMGGVSAAVVVLKEVSTDVYIPVACWPSAATDVSFLAPIAEEALGERRGIVLAEGTGRQFALPIEAGPDLLGAVAIAADYATDDAALRAQRSLYWGMGWVGRMAQQTMAEDVQRQIARARLVMDLSLEILGKARLPDAALVLVNRLALDQGLVRASVGLVRNGSLRLVACSHSARLQRENEAVQPIERAMEEAFDQGSCIAFPPFGEISALQISDAHAQLLEVSEAGVAASFPFSYQGRSLGVLTLEYPEDYRPGPADIALGEGVAHLAGAALASRLELDHWFTGRWKFTLRDYLERTLGPDRPSYKLGTALAVLVIGFLALAEGEYRVTARTVVEGLTQRSAVAPYQGFLEQAPVKAGDVVEAGQLLARMDDKDLQLERVRWTSEREQSARKLQEAMAKHDRASARVIAAQLQESEAQLALVDEKLNRSRIKAPFAGVVVSGDWRQLLGTPVEQGKVLFEIAPLDAYRVILKVDERDVLYVSEGQQGELALSGLAGEHQVFRVEKVTPVATAEGGSNVFRVEARLDKGLSLRPGMEGVGKIAAGRRKWLWIWTHRFTDWLRISLWRWLP